MLNISTNFPVMINLHSTYYLQGKLPYRPAKHTKGLFLPQTINALHVGKNCNLSCVRSFSVP